MPRALWWSHNAYYHRWLLRHMPDHVASALDVGCGFGWLAARLSTKADRVDAIDRDQHMIELARKRHPDTANYLLGDVIGDEALPLDPHGYSLVTSVSALHHMPLRPALHRFAELVRPGGMLAIIGMTRSASLADYAMDGLSIPANAAVGVWLALRGRRVRANLTMPMLDPQETFAQIRDAARDIVPGAIVRRRLYFRYSLLWRRPVDE